jgi:small subunit ribosomal protein S7e
MFNRSKIIKKGDAKVTELEEEFAKALQQFELANTDLANHTKSFLLNSVEQVEFKQHDGTVSKYMLVRIPFRSLGAFKKVGNKVIEALEAKFKWPVIIFANRTIVSPNALHHASQKRPRSRTLTAVHRAILDDIVVPSSITGRTTRISVDGKKHDKIFLDPLDTEAMTPRLDAIAHAYNKLTTHHIAFDFSKPTSFQRKKIEQIKSKKSQ